MFLIVYGYKAARSGIDIPGVLATNPDIIPILDSFQLGGNVPHFHRVEH